MNSDEVDFGDVMGNAANAGNAANVGSVDNADNADNASNGATARETLDAWRETLDAWRERGADRLDPLRFHFIAALERRAAAHSGDARRVLDDRLSTLIAAYSADVERVVNQPAAAQAESGVSACASDPHANHANDTETLAGLVDYLARHASPDRIPSAANHASGTGSYPELPALDYFREVWSKVRTEKQIRQSLAPVSGNAGPLNSSSLVHRALSLMSELSPGYFKQFLSYVDTLSWMEQMNGGGAPASKETTRSGTAGRGGRGKAR